MWVKPSDGKLAPGSIVSLNRNYIACVRYWPREFSRKPRPASTCSKWEGTEFLQFLLYTGPVILQNVLSEEKWYNFLKFSLGIRLLLQRQIAEAPITLADTLLRAFFTEAANLYGEWFGCYNPHGLIHLVLDARKHGPMYDYSCFAFESYLSKLKVHVRKGNKYMEQLLRIFYEIELNLIEEDVVVNQDPVLKICT